MKKLLILALLASLHASTFAQASVTLDSSWIVNTAGVFYEHRLIEFLNGESNLTKKRLGDTAQVVATYRESFTSQTTSWAGDIEWTSTIPKKITELIRQDQSLTATLGKSPVKSILDANKYLVDSTFKTKDGNKTRAIKFTVTQSGILRYKIDTFATRNATILGNALRLNNYLNTGTAIDLYKFRDGRWRDANRSIQIFLQSAGPQSANRDMPPGIFADVPVELVQSPITYEGGLVHAYGLWLRYDTKKKQWVSAKPKAGIIPQPERQ